VSAVFYSVIIGYVIVIIYEARKTRKHSLNAQRKATWTLFLLFLAYVIAIVGGLIEYHLAQEIDIRISLVGIALILVKILLKGWSMRALGKYYSAHIMVGEHHELIKSGPYKYVRHPAYSARFLSIIGITLMLNAFYTLFIALVVDLTFVLIRIRFEERELIGKFGEQYLAYKRQAWAIIPFKTFFVKRDVC
jgi:protein-S-isoprenylcysteine O-methyltransferase Ste14